MSWQDDLAKVSARRNSPQLAVLCADDNPHHGYWRQRVTEMANGVEPSPRAATEPTPLRPNVKASGCCGGYNPLALDDPDA